MFLTRKLEKQKYNCYTSWQKKVLITLFGNMPKETLTFLKAESN